MAEPLHISVVVLAWNSERFMEGCLDALQRSQGVQLEIICVDNASTDRSHEIAEAHPATTKALRSEINRGCAGGNNFGWRAATAPYVVFINPDCRVQPDALRELVAPLAEDETIGVTGARLYYPSTRILQHAGGILHPNAMCEHHGMGKEDDELSATTRDVDYVTGALIGFRRADLESLDGFDEELHPAYYEETDLCERLKARGKRIRYVASAIAYHHESVGLTKNSTRFVRTSYRSRIIFVIKNFSAGRFFGEFLPFETKWFFGPFAKGFRVATLRSYASGGVFALKCLLRFSKRKR